MTDDKRGRPRESPEEIKGRATYSINEEAQEKVRICSEYNGVSKSVMVQTFILAGSNSLQLLDLEDRINTLDLENRQDVKATEETIAILEAQIKTLKDQLQRRIELREQTKSGIQTKIDNYKQMTDELKKINEELKAKADSLSISTEEAERLAVVGQSPAETEALFDGKIKGGENYFNMLSRLREPYARGEGYQASKTDAKQWDRLRAKTLKINWRNVSEGNLQFVLNALQDQRIDQTKTQPILEIINSWINEPDTKED